MVVIFTFSHANTLPIDRHLGDSIHRFSDLCAKQGGTFILQYPSRLPVNSSAFTCWMKILRISALKTCEKKHSLDATKRRWITHRWTAKRLNEKQFWWDFSARVEKFYKWESEHGSSKWAQKRRPTARQKTQNSCASSAKKSFLNELSISRDPQFIVVSIGQRKGLFPQSPQRSWVKIRVIFYPRWGAKSAKSPLNLKR